MTRFFRTVALCLLLSLASPASGADWRDDLPFDLHGFIEAGLGFRTQNDPQQSHDLNYGELRLQLEAYKAVDAMEFQFRLDLFRDEALHEFNADLREAHLLLTPTDFADLKVGRQILTWGTGDLIFLNDLFPKDFESFFIGREESYLKAPSNSVKISLFPGIFNFDLVWTPIFNSDRFVDGERLSFFNPFVGSKVGERLKMSSREPETFAKDAEYHLRLSKNIKGYETALYGYYGFFKNPGGFNLLGEAIFPRLAVYGASVRGNLFKGIGNLEIAYYDSLKDQQGDNPFINNSQFRFLTGYTQELITNLNIGLQYYLEHMRHHTRFLRALPPGFIAQDENRHTLTLRLTHLSFQQNLRLSLFTFHVPSDGEWYLRPSVNYKVTDALSATVGGNIFTGGDGRTFFSQLEDNTNVYARVRFSY
ncbi:MAG: hypothetical protein GWO19_17790 [Nitrospinaceae bacterium]|nr:hypothetical protein [Nitrospinaceae bacterium]NIR56179.1 hypothetical protein [Nitrospinaceae bacterium]NIS86635.1 hypothetical protein [Nitrospinaceae bacterium]NIT83468.1 hypothetical protein [Nitrospinaceae bacterium]NIU45673.1 hypothetical protein [Nitrospinaceae bacterium]